MISSVSYMDMVHSHTAFQDLKVPLVIQWLLSSTLHNLMLQFIQASTTSKYLVCSFNSKSPGVVHIVYCIYLPYSPPKPPLKKLTNRDDQSRLVIFLNGISWKGCVNIIKGVGVCIQHFKSLNQNENHLNLQLLSPVLLT